MLNVWGGDINFDVLSYKALCSVICENKTSSVDENVNLRLSELSYVHNRIVDYSESRYG
jgi:hypothetical protein